MEIGPGHGEHLLQAVENTGFQSYYGIDISKTSAQMCEDLLRSRLTAETMRKVRIEQKDFFTLENGTFSAVIAGEVLEHVENPEEFLRKIHSVTTEESFIYVATVANCPQKDHIFLFHSVDEIERLYESCGFKIEDSVYVPTNGYTMEKAMKQRAAINTAHILRRK